MVMHMAQAVNRNFSSTQFHELYVVRKFSIDRKCKAQAFGLATWTGLHAVVCLHKVQCYRIVDS